jgi:class 3 adenylate cyclase/tetratricopeptide (TPR) repeat protein
VICSTCGTENEAGRKFCDTCAAPLAAGCPACGAPNRPTARFCGECATPLISAAAKTGRSPVSPSATPARVAERRLVSVLFADLVGFTPFAEERDAEETRELLTRYFDVARDVIERYGGTVEKFIGDAVMAVWGAPVAREDDAERAVRAGLELVDAVKSLGPTIQARAGILTGEAAVTIGATNQGMVAGDLVNTASRLQGVAPPGAVLVGESTQRAAAAAIAFEEAGEQLLKGKAAPVPAWRALRVVAERGGRNRSEGVEAPFVGRDEELRLLKDLFHATVREGRARLLSVTGQAGIGKSRLAWELEKYLDGLAGEVARHHGRSPAYGEGITFWALAEMVRGRAGIAESDDDRTSREKLATALAGDVPDEADRGWVAPRLGALLGIEEAPTGERAELFAAWRMLFEQVAARGPAVLIFEDLQWADAGLLDFIESMLEWSRAHPILIVTLARPELLDRRPTWGAGQRSFTSLHLEPLTGAAMAQLLTGLAPGLPDTLVQRIVARAEGIPLYAVETVRMLLDDAKLVAADGGYRLVDEVERLAVPQTLQALIAARLDGLDTADRRLVQDAAVLGQTFTLDGLAILSGEPAEGLEPRLRTLVRKELFVLNSDPRSPERGQYGFVQSLIREVAYAALARKERLARHLATARYLEAFRQDELAGMIASHYLAASEASPMGPEAEALAARARVALRDAAERATALHSHDQALGYLEQALRTTNDPGEHAALEERAAEAAQAAGKYEVAERYLNDVIAWHREQGDRIAAARATARLGTTLIQLLRLEPAIAALEGALSDLASLESDPEVASFSAQLARAYVDHDDTGPALAWADRAIAVAERLDLVPVITDALITRGSAAWSQGRPRESRALFSGALALAERHVLVASELRARSWLADLESLDDPTVAQGLRKAGLELARRTGDRESVSVFTFDMISETYQSGDWDGVIATIDALEEGELVFHQQEHLNDLLAVIAAYRGDTATAQERLVMGKAHLAGVTHPTHVANYRAVVAEVALAEGRFEEAYAEATAAAVASPRLAHDASRLGARAAAWMGDGEHVREALYRMAAADRRGRWFDAGRRTVRAALASLAGEREAAIAGYLDAAALWRDVGWAVELGFCQLDFASLIGPDQPTARAAADEAREIFTRLGAAPLLARLDAALARRRQEPG